MINFYEKIPQNLKPKYHNPGYKDHGIEVPFMMLVAGKTGSYKSNFILNLIEKMNDTFHEIILVTKQVDEPLYAFLKKSVPKGQISVYDGVEDIPPLEELDKDKETQYLIIFDDLVLEKHQGKIEEYFIRARKIAGGVSCIYITQSYYKTPKTIRINCNYIVLKKISSTRDISMILSEFNLGSISKGRLLELYQDATSKSPMDALLIDVNKTQFRKNFSLVYNI